MWTVSFTVEDWVWTRSQHVLFKPTWCDWSTLWTWSEVSSAPAPPPGPPPGPAVGPFPPAAPWMRAWRLGSVTAAGLPGIAAPPVLPPEADATFPGALLLRVGAGAAESVGGAAAAVGVAVAVGAAWGAAVAPAGTCTTTCGAGL